VLLLPDRLPEAGSAVSRGVTIPPGIPHGATTQRKARLMGRADRKYRLTGRNAGIKV
jgi:hypothetical protein